MARPTTSPKPESSGGASYDFAPGIVLGAGAGHALRDELARDPRDVHRSRRFAAETQRTDSARVRIRQGGPQLGIIGAQGGVANLKPSHVIGGAR